MEFDQIRVQYDDLEQIARRIREHGERAEQLVRRTLYCLELMEDGVWKGRGADEYVDALEFVMLPAIRRLASVYGDMSWALLKATDLLRDAEAEAGAPFRDDGRFIGDNLDAGGRGRGGGWGGFGRNIFRDVAEGRGGGGSVGNSGGQRGTGGGWGGFGRNIFRDVAEGREGDGSGGNGGTGGGWGGFGRNIFRDVAEGAYPPPDPRIPPTLSGQNGDVLRPPWFTEFNDTDGGINGAADSNVLIGGAGDHGELMNNVTKTSQALGGAGVSGVFSLNSDDVLRGPGSLPGASAASALSPAAQAMADWIRAHPTGLLILPPFNAGIGADALSALAAEGFDLFGLQVVTLGESGFTFPEGVNHRAVNSIADLRG